MQKLTPKQDAFIAAYLETGNATEAYRRAYDCKRMLPSTINNAAWQMMKNSRIAARITELREQSVSTATIDRAGVVNLITEIATADASQLSEIQIRNCRHCWGVRHNYHWTNEMEHAFRCAEILDENTRAHERWELAIANGQRMPKPIDSPMPSDAGGYGFDVRASPNPECPKCHGDGIEHVRFKDTRFLKGAAKRLFAGVKRTKDGFEVKTRDQDKMVELLAKIHRVVPDERPLTAVAVNNAPGGEVTINIPTDPLAASQAYQELMKS